MSEQDTTTDHSSEWAPLLNIDKARLLRNRDQIRDVLDRLIDRARIEIPDDYDLEAAFADVLSLGAAEAPPEVQPAIVRLAVFIYDRLPKEG